MIFDRIVAALNEIFFLSYRALLVLTITGFFILSNIAYASNIVKIAVGSENIPFLLDDKGQVWTFHEPLSSSVTKPYKLENLNHIKKIAPYIAIDEKGNVFVWHLNPSKSSWDIDDGSILDAVYTKPERVENLKGVSLVTSSSDHYFVAVMNNNRIVDFESAPDKAGTDLFINNKFRTITSRQGIKSISAYWEPSKDSREGVTIVPSVTSVVALLDDGDVVGWGVKSTGVASRDEDWNEKVLTKAPGAISVAMNAMHTVVLLENGVSHFFGGCEGYRNGLDFKGEPWPQGNVEGVPGSVVDVSVMSLFSGYDNVKPNVFIKRDGTVWAAYAPAPAGMLGKDCYLVARDKKQYWQIQAGKEPALQVAATAHTIYMLDAAHKLWMVKLSSMNMKFDDLKINLE